MATPTLTFRTSIPSDASSWLELLPKEMPLEPSLAAKLPRLWRELIADEAIEARTILVDHGGRESIDAFGASVFLRSGMIEEIRDRPQPGLAARLYTAIDRGERPILTGRDLARANSGPGVDVCVLHFCQRVESLEDAFGQQLLAMGHAAFRDAHLGYNVRSIVHESFGRMHRTYQLASGLTMLHDFGTSAEFGTSCIVGMTRERSLAEPAGSPISFLFRSTPPRYFFSASERRVLRLAISGKSDSETAAALGVSFDAVKNAWKRVFERIETLAPARRADAPHRRRELLDYLRQHPEELRPYLRPQNWPEGIA